MPGLFGCVDLLTGNCEENLLEKMMMSLFHFDFYHGETIVRDGVHAGSISLAENKCAKQLGDILVVYYGEIYDVIDSRDLSLVKGEKVDASTLIELYRKYGEQLPEKLNGSFNIFLHDSKKNVSFIFNDRFGYKPLYLFQDTNVLLFSPEMKSFLVYDKFIKIMDPHGLSDYFTYFYQFSDRTFFKNVKLFPPASTLKISGSEVSIRTYWNPVYSNSQSRKNLRNAIREGYGLFEQSVSRCFGDSHNVLVPLSGGLDSRLIMAVAARRNLLITTATFGTRHCLDYRLAKKVCNSLDVAPPQLINISPDWLQKYAGELIHLNECSFGALGMTTQHGMAKYFEGQFDVVLNGIYGGHLSFGSPYYTNADLENVYSSTSRIERIRRGFNGHRFSKVMKSAVSIDVQNMVDEYADKTIVQEWQRSEQVSDQDHFRQDYLFLYNRIRRGMNDINQNTFFFNDRQPFASYELFDFYLSLSPELTLGHYLYKEIYKEMLPQLAMIPWQQTGTNLYGQSSRWVSWKRAMKKNISWYVPKLTNGRFSFFDQDNYDDQDIVYRKNVDLQKWIKSILLSERCLDRGYYAREGLSDLLEKEKRGQNFFYEIGKMVMFELWAREFVDGDGASCGN